jgi:8-oxo-dGTP diphosphatase
MTYTYEYPHPAVTVDACLFTILESRMSLLLIRRGIEPFRDCWALPGGFVQIDEDLATAAKRELEEETGATGFYLEQLQTFGAVDRDPRERVISVAYFALAPADHIALSADTDASAAAWFAVEALPELAFDHDEIVQTAITRVREKIQLSSIAFAFLPPKFTISDAREVYESVHGESIDKRNFQKWLLSRNWIRPLGEKRGGAHRPAELYELNRKKT